MAINSRMEKHMVVYLYKGMLLSNAKKWAIDSHNNMNESQNNYTKWKKPYKEEFTWYDSTYVKS